MERMGRDGPSRGGPAKAEPADRPEPVRRPPHLLFEQRLWAAEHGWIAGSDEVGRGPLAGPVVAAAVVFPRGLCPDTLRGVDDSKRLSSPMRKRLAAVVRQASVAWSIASVDAGEVDRLNILVASQEAMRRAIDALPLPITHALVDGLRNPRLRTPHTAVVGGDGVCLSIAAASVLAKVYRDALMVALDLVHPGYGFAEHKGYPTVAHRAALLRLGPCPVHRRSFRLV